MGGIELTWGSSCNMQESILLFGPDSTDRRIFFASATTMLLERSVQLSLHGLVWFEMWWGTEMHSGVHHPPHTRCTDVFWRFRNVITEWWSWMTIFSTNYLTTVFLTDLHFGIDLCHVQWLNLSTMNRYITNCTSIHLFICPLAALWQKNYWNWDVEYA